jgi:hypothetical protein
MSSALSYAALAIVTATALPFLLRHPRSSQTELGEVYRCSFGFLVFSWVLTMTVAAIPLFFLAGGVELDLPHVMLFGFLSAIFLLATISTSLYRIIVGRESIVVGGFWKRTVPFRDISDVSVRSGGQGYTFLSIQYRGRHRIGVSSYAADLQALERTIRAKIQAVSSKP